ncbi:MAG: hypothetical protein U1D64_04660 [Bacteroidales bacterium]|nr:hypothetical protein [Bacteroidales bacterium]
MEDNNTIIHSTLKEGYDFFFTDKWAGKHHFKISTFMVPSGLLSEAMEVIEDSPYKEVRVYRILSDFESNIEDAEHRLKEKVKKGVNKKYLEYSDGRYSIKGSKIKGRFLGDCFEIDGLKFTPEEFIETFDEYQGWDFSISFHDNC